MHVQINNYPYCSQSRNYEGKTVYNPLSLQTLASIYSRYKMGKPIVLNILNSHLPLSVKFSLLQSHQKYFILNRCNNFSHGHLQPFQWKGSKVLSILYEQLLHSECDQVDRLTPRCFQRFIWYPDNIIYYFKDWAEICSRTNGKKLMKICVECENEFLKVGSLDQTKYFIAHFRTNTLQIKSDMVKVLLRKAEVWCGNCITTTFVHFFPLPE